MPGDLSRPATSIRYNSTSRHPSGTGEFIPVDDAAGSGAYDASGLRAAYFVDDAAIPETLTQTVSLQDGVKYTFGFDIYIPANDFANRGGSIFTAAIGGFEFATVEASDGPVEDWVHYQAYGIAGADGQANFVLSFFSGPGPSQDFVVDDVFFAAVDPDAPLSLPDTAAAAAAVPEPGSWMMLATGLATLGAFVRRRSGTQIAMRRHARDTRSMGRRLAHRD